VIASLWLWPGGLRGGVAWADVARQFGEVRSFTAWASLEETAASGKKKISHLRLYQKDPSLSRSEAMRVEQPFPPPGDEAHPATIESISIMRGGRDRVVSIRLDPRQRTAHRTTVTFGGTLLAARAEMPRDLVSGIWSRLTYLTSDQTRTVGRRQIDGREVTGFEAEIRDLIAGPAARPVAGQVRVWADADSGVPVEVELEFTDPQGGRHHTTYGALKWNVELPDELFAIPDDGTWTILEERIEKAEFAETRLRDGVTLRIGPRGGPDVITEREIAAVRAAETIRRTGQAALCRLWILTTAEGAETLSAYTSAHLGERVRIDFNGEFESEITIGGRIAREMRLDLPAPAWTLEEFENRYLSD
jgi:hypothetical protein